MKKYNRKEFLKIATLANIALFTNPLKSLSLSSLPKHSDNVLYYKRTDATYDVLRKGFNKRIDRFPAIIAVCKNATGVSEAVLFAVANKWPITIKSGGHSMEGFSVNEGMVINLSLLNTINWVDENTINVGPACILKDLYANIISKGKIMPGGSCGTVGIGGLTLGGGYGLLSRQFGLACDNLLEVTMVDGHGKVVNSTTEKDLLWACRGGGNGNFGIITNMKFGLHKAPAIMQSWRFKAFKTDIAKAKSIFESWFKIVIDLPNECFSTCLQNGKTTYILLTSTNSSTKKIDQVIKDLSVLVSKTTHTKPQPLATALKTYYGQSVPIYFKNASAGLYKNFMEIDGCLEKVLAIVQNTSGMIYQVNTLGGNIQNAQLEAVSCFAHRDKIFFSELQTYWQSPIKSEPIIAKFEEVQQLFAKNGVQSQYCNYPDINFKNWQTAYYGPNYNALQLIKTKYDPDNHISSRQSIQPVGGL